MPLINRAGGGGGSRPPKIGVATAGSSDSITINYNSSEKDFKYLVLFFAFGSLYTETREATLTWFVYAKDNNMLLKNGAGEWVSVSSEFGYNTPSSIQHSAAYASDATFTKYDNKAVITVSNNAFATGSDYTYMLIY